jgi:hypothetical protein
VTNWMPWPLYRLCVRYRMWRNSGPDLNNRVSVEGVLLAAAKSGTGLNAEQCRALAYKLGVPQR